MRKKLDTRFPAARIKKIMQADEDVGKIAMAVPLLVSKALELFLQDLCDRTYEITIQRGAKTMNSLHLKQCVRSFNVFDFLRDIVSRVPDLGGSDAAGDDRSAVKRRKLSDDEDNDSDEESRKGRMQKIGHTSTNGRGRGRVRSRGRGRGRGRGRDRGGGRTVEEPAAQYEKLEVDPKSSQQRNEKLKQSPERQDSGADLIDSKDHIAVGKHVDVPVRNFDLNLDLDENGNSPIALVQVPVPASLPPLPASASPSSKLELKPEEYPGWSLADVERMAIDPLQLANLNRGLDEDEEDYDEED